MNKYRTEVVRLSRDKMTQHWQEAHEGRLQARKSSYEAWKCVSLGCSLIVILMLASKCHQTTTDLNLLLSISRLIQAADEPTPPTTPTNSSLHSIAWPPVPIELLLPAANESSIQLASMDSVSSNESMLMSHLHVSLGREMTGDQLLRQEVDSFVAEFRSTKSTLCLSSALVAIYILSWILMSLAINDKQISNDISLRNILLLCIFGAIDMAASFGFVMVRLVMYSVKNNSFLDEMLAFNGLRNTSIRLSGDQLTAFTSLRLIAMRSCSAHTDLYVSIVVVLLTVLRLFTTVKALSYYQLLKKFVNSTEYSFTTNSSLHSSIPQPASAAKLGPLWTTFQPFHQHNSFNTAPNPPAPPPPAVDDLSLCPNVDPFSEHPRLNNNGYLRQHRAASLEDALRGQRKQQVAVSGFGTARPHSVSRTLPGRETTESSGSARTSQLYLLPNEKKPATRASGHTSHSSQHNTTSRRRQKVPDLLLVNGKSTGGLEELVCAPRSDEDAFPTGVVTAEKSGTLSYTLLDPSQLTEARRTGRLFVAHSEPETSGKIIGATSRKYRLVAKYKRTANRKQEQEKSTEHSESVSTTSSSGADSDNSAARLHKSRRDTGSWQTTGNPGMKHTEELVGHKVYQVLSKTPSSLLKKYYYT